MQDLRQMGLASIVSEKVLIVSQDQEEQVSRSSTQNGESCELFMIVEVHDYSSHPASDDYRAEPS